MRISICSTTNGKPILGISYTGSGGWWLRLHSPGKPITRHTCSPQLGNSAWQNANITLDGSGNGQVIINATPNTYRLACSNSTATRTATVTITDQGSGPFYPGNRNFPAGCNSTPVPGTTWQNNHFLYEDSWGTWPGNGTSNTFNIVTNQWVAMWFATADSPSETGALRTNEAPGQGTSGTRVKMMKISECPGDFEDDVPGQTCRFDSPVNNGELRWESGDFAGTGTSNRCTLQRNKAYYLNVIFGEQDDPSDTTCKSNDGGTVFSQCGFFMIPDPD